MKYQFVFVCFIFLFYLPSGFSQDTTLTWINDAGISVGKEGATMYRQSWPWNDLWIVRDYYPDGQIRMTGSYTTNQFIVKHGLFKFFTKYNVKILEVQYDNDHLTGQSIAHYDNGVLSETGRYMEDLSREERINLVAALPNELPYSLDSTNLKTGTWVYYHGNGNLSGREEYQDGLIIHAIYWFEDGSDFDNRYPVHRMAQFPGGRSALADYLHQRVKLPDIDAFKRVSGVVKIQFTIDEKGQIKDPKIIRSLTPTTDASCMEIVKNMPLWIPARLQNRLVKMDYVLPFQFVQPRDFEIMRKQQIKKNRAANSGK